MRDYLQEDRANSEHIKVRERSIYLSESVSKKAVDWNG